MNAKAIIGAGAMGTWFARTHQDVLIADKYHERAEAAARKTGTRAVTLEEALEADEIIIAVSLQAAKPFVEEYAPQLEGKIVYDVASVKVGIVPALAKASEFSYSIHPMWGGSAKSWEGDLAIIPTHDSKAYKEFFAERVERYKTLGCKTYVLTEDKHDTCMVTLGLAHFTNIVYAATRARLGLSEGPRGTTQRKQDSIAAGVMNEDPTLYGGIQMMLGDKFHKAIRTYNDVATELAAAVAGRDEERFRGVMEEGKTFYGTDSQFLEAITATR